ncbi:uncharacterized protein LOC122265578 [Penaeus japonicus]|uniref:uncharacterized protein LOC122265578 n=1 Tax=Penaeus japonicus TaxID=27405 RepID=UPI001C715D75|nr:uncharacterized protein LOC122265578 [Penaeus japonicus]
MHSHGRMLLTLAALVAGAWAHTLHLGRTCPEVTPFQNLSVDKILGEWYVIHMFSDIVDNTCLVWNMTRGTEPDTIVLKETRQLAVLDVFNVNHTHAVSAVIDIPNLEVPSKMRIRWPTSITGKADFIIFDTDYDTYMAVFECDRAGLLHRRSVAILSRTKTIDELFLGRVRRLLDTAKVDHSALVGISHDSCREIGEHNWHVDDELFDILPGTDE